MALYNTERNTARDDNRYSRTLWQQGKYVFSDELNSSHVEDVQHLRNVVRDLIGNLCIDSSLAVGATVPATTSITISPGTFYVAGFRFNILHEQILDLGASP